MKPWKKHFIFIDHGGVCDISKHRITASSGSYIISLLYAETNIAQSYNVPILCRSKSEIVIRAKITKLCIPVK